MNAARMLAIALVGLLVLGVFYAGPAPPRTDATTAAADRDAADVAVPAGAQGEVAIPAVAPAPRP